MPRKTKDSEMKTNPEIIPDVPAESAELQQTSAEEISKSSDQEQVDREESSADSTEDSASADNRQNDQQPEEEKPFVQETQVVDQAAAYAERRRIADEHENYDVHDASGYKNMAAAASEPVVSATAQTTEPGGKANEQEMDAAGDGTDQSKPGSVDAESGAQMESQNPENQPAEKTEQEDPA